MAFKSHASGIAASVYLAIYSIFFAFTINIVFRVGWRSFYTALAVYGIFRFSGQLCAVVFSVLGYTYWQWLVAYLVFTAEGYFMLILISYFLIAQAQEESFGTSWIGPSKKDRKRNAELATTKLGKLKAKFPIAVIFHLLLIPANVLIIVGGSQLAGISIQDANNESSKVHTSKIMRTAGQSVFLFQTVAAIGFASYCYFVEKIRHINIYTIFAVAPFITIRGIFGILSIYIQKMNYYDFTNYTVEGLSSSFVTYEYVLATTMEFVTALGYIANYYIRANRKKGQLEKVHLMEEVNDTDEPTLEKKIEA
ncbi:uncharacterized protein RJT21DRAFT_14024 [Scheffersomyces amazonensis]|uniref:uncharacterized protein n=1 Tax=Scheffersomyces amazonensis TaxID=1078765 RepID=UPI00315CA530